jgi:hypothetical protein
MAQMQTMSGGSWVGSYFDGAVNAAPDLLQAVLQKGDIRISDAIQDGKTAPPKDIVKGQKAVARLQNRPNLPASAREQITTSQAYLIAYAKFSQALLDGNRPITNMTDLARKMGTDGKLVFTQPLMLSGALIFNNFAFVNETGTDHMPFLAVGDAKNQILMAHSQVSNVLQPLDGIIWADVVFRDSEINYNGGPLTLANVTFERCSFSISNFVPYGDEGQPWINVQPDYFRKEHVADAMIARLRNAKGPVSIVTPL